MLVQLSGIARLAAEGRPLQEKSRVEYRTLPTRKWLNRCNSRRVPFHWTINPYRGCEYGCKYCYARFTHDFLELRTKDAFETEIYAKDFDPSAFRKELKGVRPGHVIGVGTATDPYQPAERKFGKTRGLLESLTPLRQTSIFVTTKSDLVARDADLYRELSRHNNVRITVTVTTAATGFARLTEPFAPRPDLRIHAVSLLASAGVHVGVIASPVLPLLTDSREQLRSVALLGKQAGASYFGAGVLFLKPEARTVFLAFLAENFPQHSQRYETNYKSGAYLKGAYPERIARLVDEIRTEVGLQNRDLPFAPVPVLPDPQLRLF